MTLVLGLGLRPAAGQPYEPSDGPVSWWPGQYSAADIQDGNHGIFESGTTYAPAKVGDGFSLSGSNYVRVPDAPNLRQETLTIEAWVKLDNAAGGIQCIMCKPLGDAYRNSYALWIQNSRLSFVVSSSSAAYASVNRAPVVPSGEFFHVAMTWDGDTMRGYFNGEHVDTIQVGAVTIAYDTRPLLIGADINVKTIGLQLKGIIDEPTFWCRALTDAEIKGIFDAGSAGKSAPALAPDCPGTGGGDSDGDGVPDDQDVCPGGDDTVNSDGDLAPDYCDICPLDADNDADGDGVCGDVDTCPGGNDAVNSDGDSMPDFCDVCPLDADNDVDGDGICGDIDNCLLVANANQDNKDGDEAGDACDADDDNDGVEDGDDNCPLDANADQANFDGDGAGDVCDTDDDNDGVVDGDDQCQATEIGALVNADGCSIANLCPCDNNWKNHGAYVKCVAHTANDFVELGLISDTEHDDIVSAAGQSSCGAKQ